MNRLNNLKLSTHITIGFLISSIIVLSVSYFYLYKGGTAQIEELLSKKLQAIARSSAEIINHQDHSRVVELYLSREKDIENTKEFKSLKNSLNRIKEIHGLQNDVYTFINPNWAKEKIVFIGMSGEKNYTGNAIDITEVAKKLFSNESSSYSTRLYEVDKEYWISGMSVLRNREGEIIGGISIDYNASKNMKEHTEGARRLFITSIVVSLILSVLLGLAFGNNLGRPIRKFSEFIGNYYKNEGDSAFSSSGLGSYEINLLSESFNTLIQSLKEKEKIVAAYTQGLELRIEDSQEKLKNKEEEIKNQLVKISQERSFVKNNPNPVFRMSFEGDLLISNKAAEKAFGNRGKIKAINFLELMNLKPEQIQDLKERQKVTNVELEHDGEYYSMLMVPDVSNNFINVYSHNISMIKELNDKVSSNSKLAAIGLLAAGVGHEINNPLTVINLTLKLASKGSMSEDGTFQVSQKQLGQIHEASDRIKKIVSDLRCYSRSEENEVDIFNLEEEVVTALKAFQKSQVDDQVLYNLDLEESCTIKAHRYKIKQVVTNLLSNAHDAVLQASETRGVINLSLRRVKNKVEFHIEDNGVGIDQESVSKIFDSFYTTKSIGKGTGLGLGITSAIVRDAGGEIKVKSGNKSGAKFIVSFPFYQLEGTEKLVKKPREITKEFNVDMESKKILVVEDEAVINEYLCDLLESEGHEVTSAPDGKVALEKISENDFDIVLSDLIMPNLNGVQLAQALLEMPNYNKEKIIFLTGGDPKNFEMEMQQDLYSLASNILYKPIDEEKLFQVISKFSLPEKKKAA